MDLLIYETDYTLIGIVDTASSVIWANRFRQCGDFEIYVPASAQLLELLTLGRAVGRSDDDMLGIIERVEITTDEESGDYMIVTGRCMRSILDRRIVWDQTIFSGTVENGLRKLVTDAYISPTDPDRKYELLTLAAAHGYTERTRLQNTGTVLLDAIEERCAAHNLGFKITLGSKKLVLDFYKGSDRSADQSLLPRLIFSEDFDNLTASHYVRDQSAYKTVALIAGEGEGAARKKTTVSKSADTVGLARREMYIDARDISTNDGEISDSEYAEMLAERGSSELQSAAVEESMEGSVEAGQMHTYKVDYFLGDTVTVINKYGIVANAQVLEVIETWDENGYTCTPTFG